MSSSLVGSSSSGSGGVERGRATNRLQRWQCGGIMHDMLKKGSWCIPLSKAYTLRNEVGIAHLQVALAHQFNSTPLVCYQDECAKHTLLIN